MSRTPSRLRLAGAALLAVVLIACADRQDPTTPLSAQRVSRSGGTTDTGTTTGGGGGGGGGGTTTSSSCGTLSNISATTIVVYTTRTGIGLTGNATNCGTRKESFEVDATDLTTDPACVVAMPHYIAPKYTDPGLTTTWQVNSTLIPCTNQAHTFGIRLWDTRTGATMDTSTASIFL